MSNIDIERLRKLHAATTQGEWTNRVCGKVTTNVGFIADCDVAGNANHALRNSVFISAAHNSMPALLDELERLREENAALKGKPNE